MKKVSGWTRARAIAISENTEIMSSVNELVLRFYGQEYIDYARKFDASVIVSESLPDEKLLGTISYTIDGPVGLVGEETFPLEIKKIRGETPKLASIWRFIAPKIIKDTLIEAVVRELINEEIPLCVFIVHPKHKNFYEDRLSCICVSENIEGGFLGRPSILMAGYPEEMMSAWVGY